MDLRCGCFSPKMYAKMKELGPVGRACARHAPPRSANEMFHFVIIFVNNFTVFGISEVILLSVFLQKYSIV